MSNAISDTLRIRIESAVNQLNARCEYPSRQAVAREIGRNNTNLRSTENEIRKSAMKRLEIPIKKDKWHYQDEN